MNFKMFWNKTLFYVYSRLKLHFGLHNRIPDVIVDFQISGIENVNFIIQSLKSLKSVMLHSTFKK